MWLLALDTCLDKTYITLTDGVKFENRIVNSNEKNYHSAYLISTIVEILKQEGLEPRNLDCIAINNGPGSFTGIRACTTVARMLAQQLNIRAIGVSSLEILSKAFGGQDVVALDARKNKAYVYNDQILGAIELEEADEIVANRRLITDNSLIERFSQFTTDIHSYQQLDLPLGEILAKLALEKIANGAKAEWQDVKPLYIQPPPVFGK